MCSIFQAHKIKRTKVIPRIKNAHKNVIIYYKCLLHFWSILYDWCSLRYCLGSIHLVGLKIGVRYLEFTLVACHATVPSGFALCEVPCDLSRLEWHVSKTAFMVLLYCSCSVEYGNVSSSRKAAQLTS